MENMTYDCRKCNVEFKHEHDEWGCLYEKINNKKYITIFFCEDCWDIECNNNYIDKENRLIWKKD